MISAELEKYEKGKLVVRGEVKEEHRTYSAFHPEGFMRNFFKKAEVLEHIVIKSTKAKSLPQQDIWILKK